MAAVATLPALLSTLIQSITSASSSLIEPASLAPSAKGISLLDTKNELLLSYLQNLVFLIILKLRNHSSEKSLDAENGASAPSLNDEVTKKLVELRIYLEKGVRPLESRLEYQLDKLLLAASEAPPPLGTKGSKNPSHTTNGVPTLAATDGHSDIDSAPPPQISDLSHRPNPSAFVRPSTSHPSAQETTGLYRPPRIAPTSLPTTERKAAKALKPRKSTTLDTFIREEMDDAPIAEPSIGAGSGLRGKAKEMEEEKRGYEEQRLVRLPGEKKKRRRVDEDLSGGLRGLGEVDFGVKGVKVKRKREGGEGERIGERWDKRVKRGVGKKRR